MWITEFKYPKRLESEIQKIVSDIADKDSTFRFALGEGLLKIMSEDKDQAYKRGVWLKNKTTVFQFMHFNVFSGSVDA